MAFELNTYKLNNYLKGSIPSSIVENVIKKLAFTYYVYLEKHGDYPNTNVDNTAYFLCEEITEADVRNPFVSLEELKEAVYCCAKDIAFFANDSEHTCDLMEINMLMCNFTQDEYKKLLNYKEEYFNISDSYTPDTVCELTLRLCGLFGVNKLNRVTDMTCGEGNFLMKASNKFKYLDGVDINEESIMITKMRMYVNRLEGNVRHDNCFNDSWKHQVAEGKSQLAFAEFPWKRVIKDPKELELIFNCNANRFCLEKGVSADYYYLSALMNYIDSNGIAVGVVPLSTLSNINDINLRKNILRRGELKAVITLPAGVFPRTSIATALIVLSDCNNDTPILVDCSEYFIQSSRARNTLDVDAIFDKIAVEMATGKSRYTIDQMEKKNYSFSPAHYSNDLKRFIPNAKELETVADVFTGWQCPSQKLEAIHKTDGSGIKLLQMSNVEGGAIIKSLERYDIPLNTLERFKVQTGDVVISTKSLKVKSAVVDIDMSEPIVASGSIMVIRAKENMLDPYFLVSFFESEFGQETLRLYQTGSVIPNLSIGNVKKIPLPGLDINEQRSIGAEYKTLRDLITAEKRRLKNLQKKAGSMLDYLWDKGVNQ